MKMQLVWNAPSSLALKINRGPSRGKWKCVIRRANDINFQTYLTTRACRALEIIARTEPDEHPYFVRSKTRQDWSLLRLPSPFCVRAQRIYVCVRDVYIYPCYVAHLVFRARGREKTHVTRGNALPDWLALGAPGDVMKRRRADCLGLAIDDSRMYVSTHHGFLTYLCVRARARAGKRTVDERVLEFAGSLYDVRSRCRAIYSVPRVLAYLRMIDVSTRHRYDICDKQNIYFSSPRITRFPLSSAAIRRFKTLCQRGYLAKCLFFVI